MRKIKDWSIYVLYKIAAYGLCFVFESIQWAFDWWQEYITEPIRKVQNTCNDRAELAKRRAQANIEK